MNPINVVQEATIHRLQRTLEELRVFIRAQSIFLCEAKRLNIATLSALDDVRSAPRAWIELEEVVREGINKLLRDPQIRSGVVAMRTHVRQRP